MKKEIPDRQTTIQAETNQPTKTDRQKDGIVTGVPVMARLWLGPQAMWVTA